MPAGDTYNRFMRISFWLKEKKKGRKKKKKSVGHLPSGVFDMSAGSGAGTSGKASQEARKTLTKELVLKDYRQRLKDNVRSLNENFRELIRLAKVCLVYLSIIKS